MLTKAEIQQLLEDAYQPGLHLEIPFPNDFLKDQPLSASVMVLLHLIGHQWHLLFIRRTTDPNDPHSGQVAFPGGRRNHLDKNSKDTALRETNEETGINPSDIQILGRLGDMMTITKYRVSPFVGMFPWPYHLVPQEGEVARIFSIPLDWLADPHNHEVRMRGLQILGQDIPVIYFQRYDNELLWGASARITIQFLEAVGFANPDNRYTIG
jgi:8-oxo-dGTP pyrophosphatase MutT (NUDIX family)